jgi:cytochrome c oxidase assembly factor CtaG
MELDPVVIALIALSGALYVRAIVRLSRRGYRVPRVQQGLWWIGLTLMTFGLVGPPAAYSDELFWAHMGEHLLIADLAVPFLLAGVRTPVGLFMPPKDLLVAIFRNSFLRRLGGTITKPLVALPLSVLVLYSWHLAPAFSTATQTPWLHAIQHQSFILASVIFWWPAIEPNRRPLPAPLWKIGYLLAGRMASILMGALFLVSNRPFYQGLYGKSEALHGITPLADQQVGASLMMITDVVVMMTMLVVFFVLSAREHDRDERAETAGSQRPT